MDNGLRFLEMILSPFSSRSSIVFSFLKVAPLRAKKRLKFFLAELVFLETGRRADLSFVFCSDSYLLRMNQKFLQHDYYTDILTFPLDNPEGMLAGEMYLSVDRIRENSTHLESSFEQELHRVMFHGVLHLCGYSDGTLSEIDLMRKKENFYLARYFPG